MWAFRRKEFRLQEFRQYRSIVRFPILSFPLCHSGNIAVQGSQVLDVLQGEISSGHLWEVWCGVQTFFLFKEGLVQSFWWRKRIRVSQLFNSKLRMTSQKGLRYDGSIDKYPITEGEIYSLGNGSKITIADITLGLPEFSKTQQEVKVSSKRIIPRRRSNARLIILTSSLPTSRGASSRLIRTDYSSSASTEIRNSWFLW